MASGEIYYACHDDFCEFRFAGDVRQAAMGSYQTGIEFAAFIDTELARRRPRNVVIDLSETEAIDSTHLGLIAQLGVYMRRQGGAPAVIISPRKKITGLLTAMGLESLFAIVPEFEDLPPALEKLPKTAAAAPEDLAAMVLRAHKELAALNESNRKTFQNLIQVLEQQLPK